MAEALAIRGALLNAVGFTNICLRTDSQVLHRAITQRKQTMDLFGVLSDADSLAFSYASPFSFCRFNFIPQAEYPGQWACESPIINHCISKPWALIAFLMISILLHKKRRYEAHLYEYV